MPEGKKLFNNRKQYSDDPSDERFGPFLFVNPQEYRRPKAHFCMSCQGNIDLAYFRLFSHGKIDLSNIGAKAHYRQPRHGNNDPK